MCGIQNDGDNFLKLFIKKFAHLGLILAHFDFGRLTYNGHCSETLQWNFMKFSALVGKRWEIIHVKFQLSITPSAVDIRLQRLQGLFYAPEEVLYFMQ